jgi:acyl-CoA reductase-like NAD-dependent aldehyde dehydrogenase
MADHMMDIQPGQLYIGGEWQAAESGDTFDTMNPSTAEPLTQVASAAEADVDRAVRAAREAFENGPWPGMDARARGRVLYAIADGLEARADELARMEAMDNGKPVREARMIDIKESIDCFRYYAGWADKIDGDVIPVPGPVPQLHAPRADGLVRGHHPVELPAADGRVEGGAGHRVRKHDGAEARRADAAHRAGAGARRVEAGLPAGC